MQEQTDRYRLLHRIGEGGMAEVWLGMGKTEGMDRAVAVKRLHGILDGEPMALAELGREVGLGLALRHNNLVSVYDLDVVDERPCLIMEHIDGLTLRTLTARVEITPAMARVILRDVLAGLEYAHAHQVLHGDISPNNIMIGRDGVAKLMDFGLARGLRKHTRPRGFNGTGAYAAREVLECEAVSRGADIYSIGAVFFEVLTGAPPFGRGDRLDLVRAMEANPRPRLPEDQPADLRAFIEFALGPTDTRSDKAVDRALDAFRASDEPAMSRADMAEIMAEILVEPRDPDAETTPVELASTVRILGPTERPGFQPEQAQRVPENRTVTNVAGGQLRRARAWRGRLFLVVVALVAGFVLVMFGQRLLKPEQASAPTTPIVETEKSEHGEVPERAHPAEPARPGPGPMPLTIETTAAEPTEPSIAPRPRARKAESLRELLLP